MLAAAGMVAALWTIGSVMPHRGEAEPTITLGGPFPLPVSAAQTGAWHVTAAQGGPWTVSTLNNEDPGRTAYQALLQQACTNPCRFGFTAPAGKRIVIQHISGFAAFGGTAPSSVLVVLQSNVGAQQQSLLEAFLAPFSAVNFGFSAFDQNTEVFLDGGTNFGVTILLSNADFNTASQAIALSGYALDCSARPCITIAH